MQKRWKACRQQEFIRRVRSDLRRFESFSLTSDGHTSASFVLDSQAKLRSGRARVLGYLGSVDSGESSEEVFSSIYPQP